MTNHALLTSRLHFSLPKNMSNTNIVTELDVSVNIFDQNLDLPWRLMVTLSCFDKSSIIAFNMDVSKPCLYCSFDTV